MRLRLQLVGALVLMGLLAAPAAAFAACWTSAGSGSQHDCCPSVAAIHPVIQARSEPAPCCKVVPGKPAPVSPLSVPASGPQLAQPAAHAIVGVMVIAHPVLGECASAPLAAASPSQSVLCTFLI